MRALLETVHVVESFAGGVFDFIVDLIKNTPECHHTVIYSLRDDTPSDFSGYFPRNTSFIEWKNASREIHPVVDLRALQELRKIVNSLRPVDVIHLHSSKAGFLGRVSSRLAGVHDKVIYTPHGVSFLRKDVSPARRRLFVWIERFGARLGGTIVACSRSEMGEFQKHGIKAMFINNGIDCGSPDDICHSKGSGKIVIGTAGRITAPKNPSLFNRIASTFNCDDRVSFVWIGDGELRQEIVSENVCVTGWMSRASVVQELKKIDIYLSTSLWEGLPLSVLQAMCFGKPLVLSDCVGNRDLVVPEKNGVLYRSAQEAVSRINEMIRTDCLGTWGYNSRRLLLENFTLNKMVCEYMSLYKSIARKS